MCAARTARSRALRINYPPLPYFSSGGGGGDGGAAKPCAGASDGAAGGSGLPPSFPSNVTDLVEAAGVAALPRGLVAALAS